MKLHDHPTMKVITYILEGSMEARIFNKEKTDNGETVFRKTVKYFERNQIALIEGEKDNFHEFVGGDDSCKFLDIIFPDYDDVHRKLTYYNYEKVGEVEDGKELYELIEDKQYDRTWCSYDLFVQV